MRKRTVLPLPLSSFVGREREIAELTRLCAVTRLLTLSGPGGCGKTRLVLELARAVQDQYPDGVWLTELAPLNDPELLPQAIAGALGISEQPGRSLLETLLEQLASRSALIILDNCEHLVLASARVAETLLSACPGLSILTTSREPLDIPGEVSWLVPSLTLPDLNLAHRAAAECLQYEAVRLFVDRASAVLPTFVLRDEDAPAVTQICVGLDGIPLAIELAAARVRSMRVTEIAARLNDSLRFLSLGSRTAPPRQQSLQAALDWSYNLLTRAEQILFARLAIFPDGFSLDALETVCLEPAEDRDCEGEALNLLSSLVSKSLVTAPPATVPSLAGASARYHLLEVVRQYAWAKLLHMPKEEVMRLREACLSYYLKLSREAEPGLRGEAQVAWLARLQAELPNMRASMQWGLEHGHSDMVTELSANLWRFWYIRGLLSEGRRWLTAALQAAGNADLMPGLCGWATNASALMACYQADYELAVRLAGAGLEVCNGDGGVVLGLAVLGMVARAAGDFALALRRLGEALALARAAAQPWHMATVLLLLGTTNNMAGQPAVAEGFLKQSLAGFRALGDHHAIGEAGGYLGLVAQMRGDYQTARAAYHEALAVLRALGSARGVAEMLLGLAVTELLAGEHEAARAALCESTALFIEIGQPYYLAISLLAWGSVAVSQGHGALAERGVRLFGAAEAVREAIKAPLPPAYQAINEPYVALGRRYLGPASFAAAWSDGRAMTLDQAVAYALEDWPYETDGAAVEPAGQTGSQRMRGAAQRTPLQAAKAQYGGLTAREREVAALIAEGKSNQEIAECLVITERTAATHVGNILSKLEFSSRAQIAAWAVARGLAKQPSTI